VEPLDQLDRDLAYVVAAELRLLERECRASRACLGDLLHPDFREHGTSGRLWSREAVLDEVPAAPDYEGEVHDLEPVRVADDVVLLTFRTVEPDRTSLRSSVWIRCDDGRWRMRFHQGTPTC